MKTIVWIVLMVSAHILWAQNHTENISKTLVFEKKSTDNTLLIANINGNISVEAYDGDQVVVEVAKTIKAKTTERLEKGKQAVKLGVIDRADTLILYVDGLCSTFGKNRKNNNQWGYHSWDCDENCHMEYDYSMDFKVKVPAGIHLNVSTINDGNVTVLNSKGAVVARNVNGSIKLTNLMREADAHTINGDVNVEYASNPHQNCRFYTLNGDINASFQKGLAANLSFESFNGSFYTNIDKLESLPVTVEKKDIEKGMVKYKVNDSRYKVGAGGAHLDFETFNGNVYLKEQN